MTTPTRADLVLSSGFLAFARHIGVLRAIDRQGIAVDAVVGTSSGALIGALYAAGHDLDRLTGELADLRPLSLMKPRFAVWKGVFSLAPLVAFLRDRLPPTFADLETELAVGVMTESGGHKLLSEGPLVESVVASCAMPYVFGKIDTGGGRYADGGAVDRLGIGPLRRWRTSEAIIAHRVRRTAGKDLDDDLTGALLIETPPSGASFLSLGDFRAQVAEAERIAAAVFARQG